MNTKALKIGGIIIVVGIIYFGYTSVQNNPVEKAPPAPISEEQEDNADAESKEPLVFEDDFEDELFDGVYLETTFEHVAPGEYSEIYGAASGLLPGTEVFATLSNPPGGNVTEKIYATADDNGVANFTWRITSYGEYEVAVGKGDNRTLSQITVR